MNPSPLNLDLARISELCQAAGVTRLYLFGSAVNGELRECSDIDLLIETDADHRPGLMALGGLQMDLSDLLGRDVHLTMLGGVPIGDRGALLAKARLLNAA